MHSLKIGESPISFHRAYPKICKRRTKCIRVACPASPESMLLHVFRPPSTCSPIEKHQWWHVFTGQDVPRFAPKNSWLGHRHLWGAAHRDTPIASSLLCFTISGWITCTTYWDLDWSLNRLDFKLIFSPQILRKMEDHWLQIFIQ